MNHAQITRRRFLSSSAQTACALTLLPHQPRTERKTKRVILVAFAGGVRAKEVLGAPQNVPNLTRIAGSGVLLPDVYATNSGHYGAALSIFTGNIENLGIRENERGLNPTLFECLAKHAGVDRGELWLSTAGGSQARLFAHSDHPQYGAAFGANVLDGDGVFNVEFKRVLDAFGRPKADSPAERALLEQFGEALDATQLGAVTGPRPDPAKQRRVEQFILDELSGNTARITGPGAQDAKAIRVGLNMLRVFQPKVLGITLQNHDIAHGSFNGYVEVIRRNDEEVGKLWDAVQGDAELRGSTAIVILPEFGRDQNLNERNGLDHGDDSEALRKVWLIAAGPDFKKGKIVKKDCRTIDVAPTVYSLFSNQAMPHSGASRIDALFS